MQMKLEPLYIRNEGNTDEDFCKIMISWVNISVMHIPLPLVSIIGCLFSKQWEEASKN